MREPDFIAWGDGQREGVREGGREGVKEKGNE